MTVEPRSITEGTDRSANDSLFQILSLDGGGLKGMFSAAVLAEFETDFQTNIVDHFDLIVGTSTGGLIALALGAGRRPSEILDMYTEIGPRVFSRGKKLPSWLFRPKHDSNALCQVLEEVFGTLTLGKSVKRLVVPSYSLTANDVYLFKTPHHVELRRDWRESMTDVARATTAAPTYFQAAPLRNNQLIDGGIWSNNPILVGIAEATSVLGVSQDRIRILSMGTTDEVANINDRQSHGGLLAWRRSGVPMLLRAQAIGSFHTAEHLLGKERIVRVDSTVPPGLFDMDRIDEKRIRGLAEDVARRAQRSVRAFTEHTASTYTPIYTEDME